MPNGGMLGLLVGVLLAGAGAVLFLGRRDDESSESTSTPSGLSSIADGINALGANQAALQERLGELEGGLTRVSDQVGTVRQDADDPTADSSTVSGSGSTSGAGTTRRDQLADVVQQAEEEGSTIVIQTDPRRNPGGIRISDPGGPARGPGL